MENTIEAMFAEGLRRGFGGADKPNENSVLFVWEQGTFFGMPFVSVRPASEEEREAFNRGAALHVSAAKKD